MTADLRIVDADCHTSYRTFVQTAESLPPETPDDVRVTKETQAILATGFREKEVHYSNNRVEGVQPWIIISLGVVHQVLTTWLGGLESVTSDVCRTL